MTREIVLSYLQDVSAHWSLKGSECLVEVGLGASCKL